MLEIIRRLPFVVCLLLLVACLPFTPSHTPTPIPSRTPTTSPSPTTSSHALTPASPLPPEHARALRPEFVADLDLPFEIEKERLFRG